MQFRHIYKILSGRRAFVANNTKLGFKWRGDCFPLFHTILICVGYDFDINKRLKVSDNKNQTTSNQIGVSVSSKKMLA